VNLNQSRFISEDKLYILENEVLMSSGFE